MKVVIHLSILMSLFALVSCGVKKSGATLRVSTGMALSNQKYAGGLVFYGRSTDGKRFSIPVAHNPSAVNNQVNIELDHGTWTFGAIGWDGATPMNSITKTECAVASGIVLDSSEKTINLDLEQANCGDIEFGANHTGTTFNALQLVTCGTFYTDMFGATLPPSGNIPYCSDNTNLAPDFKKWAKSIKISIPVLIPGQQPNNNSPISKCIDLTRGMSIGTALHLPLKNLPLQVELFESECASTEFKEVASYPLFNGVDSKYPEFDHKFTQSASEAHLYLLATISRRGESPLMLSLPNFQCGPGAPCIPFPTSNSQRYVREGNDFFVAEISGSDSCSDLSLPTNININGSAGFGSSTFATGNCFIRDGKMFLRLSNTNLAPCSTICTLNIVLPSGIKSLTLLSEPIAVNSLAAHENIFSILGHTDLISATPAIVQTNAINSFSIFNQGNKHEDRHFGILSHARDFFRPEIAGFFAGLSAGELNNSTAYTTMMDDGIFKTYQLKSEADLTNIPPYITDNSNISTTLSSQSFTHKLIISRVIGNSIVPETIIRYVFGEQVGMLESRHTDIDLSKNERRIEKSILYWNTQNPNTGRLENYRIEKVVKESLQSEILQQRTSYIRAERGNLTTDKSVRIDNFSFQSKKDISTTTATYNEDAQKSSTFLKGNYGLYNSSHAELKNTNTPLTYFNDTFFNSFNRSSAIKETTAFIRSPDKNHTVTAWSEFDGTNWDLKVLRKSFNIAATVETFQTNSSSFFVPKVSINNSGEAGVAWSQVLPGSNNSYAMVNIGNAWINAGTLVGSFNLGEPAYTHPTQQLPIAIIDNDPLSTVGSNKTIVYLKFDTPVYNVHPRTFNRALQNWAIELPLIATLSTIPTTFEIYKGDLLFWLAMIDSSKLYILQTTLFTPATTSINHRDLLGSGHKIKAFKAYNMLELFISGTSGTISKFIYSSGPIVAPTILSSSYQINNEAPAYCFVRGYVSQEIGSAAQPLSDCKIPETSAALPIKKDIIKLDIESLKPDAFEAIFNNLITP